jgi:C4-dicarboxylate-specific signal transduction histidine kinase
MGEMTTGIAHELNQPLTAIATTADVCVEQARRPETEGSQVLAEALHEISSQAHRAAAIIKHVRTFARRKEPELAPVALAEIVNGALSLVRVEARSSGVTLETGVDHGLVAEADPVLVEQVVVNLARNAIEAMEAAGTQEPRVSVEAAAAEGEIEIRVTDNGPGLSDEAGQYLFEPFYTTKTQGMGLGLAICRSIVEVHGGRMWSDSTPRGGAKLVFTLKSAAEAQRREVPG